LRMSSQSSSNGTNVIEFCKFLGRLKHLKRTGWVKKEVPEPETVACHMYRMAVLALFLDQQQRICPEDNSGDAATTATLDNTATASAAGTSSSSSTGSSKIDTTKCMKMALAHDMAESIIGDITPHCGVSVEEKFRREEEAMKTLSALAPAPIGDQLLSLWYEYEKQETAEARAVKDLDRFDMIMQAAEYEQITGKKGSLQEFFDSTKGVFDHPIVKEWVAALEHLRSTSKKNEV